MTIRQPHISVCICTYKRPELLKQLLEKLDYQDTKGLFSYSIVVVENDDLEIAKSVVLEFAAASAIPVKYYVQPRRNIALTRNNALEHANGDFIAFIDDDEFPTKEWLLRLFQACMKYDAAAVLGPVIPLFGEDAPSWIVKSGLFDRPSHPTGLRLHWHQTRTSNVLMKSQMFVDETHRFNPECLSGSDTEFFRRMISGGYLFIWSNEAVVYEVIPPPRWKRGFLLRRAVFRGVFSFRNRRYAFRPVAWSFVVAPAYVFALPVALVLGQARFMRYLFSLSYHLGRLIAVMGINPIKEPYVSD